jgi:hypothetical protein
VNRSLGVALSLLALAVVLAGCNAPASGTPASTLTPAPVPEANASTDRLAAGELAPGVEASGVTDTTRLARAHAEVLAASGYTVDQTVVRTDLNGTLDARYVTHARFAADAGSFDATLTQTDLVDGTRTTRTVERFGDGQQVYEAVTESNETRYRVVRRPDGRPRSPAVFYPTNLTNEPAIAQLFSLVETTTTDRWTENGTRYVHVQSVQRFSLPRFQNVTLDATVAESGLVSDYRVAYDVVRDGVTIHVVVAVTYTDVGETSPERPGWLDRVNATA